MALRDATRPEAVSIDPGQGWDDLEALVVEFAGEDPAFPSALTAGEECQRLVDRLYAARRAAGISRALVASRMGIPQSSLARLERGWLDPRLVTVMQYAIAIGLRLDLVTAARPRSDAGSTSAGPEQP